MSKQYTYRVAYMFQTRRSNGYGKVNLTGDFKNINKASLESMKTYIEDHCFDKDNPPLKVELLAWSLIDD